MSEVTRILSAIEQGDPSAAEQLLPLVYDELRQLAAQKLAHERAGQTLQATALVHESARRKQRVKHGGRRRIDLDEACPVVQLLSDDLLALDEALTRLAARDPIRAELVKLRFTRWLRCGSCSPRSWSGLPACASG